jgi:hypothetical protein
LVDSQLMLVLAVTA